MPNPNHLMTLTLTRTDGTVLAIWTIAKEVDFDIEDLSKSQPFDFYLDDHTSIDDFAREVWEQEIVRLYKIGSFNF